ncbi:hypothetical protein [Caballeronia arationis]|uniref:hypothetical protein n=1 Tax=Caballeronia arationis TaxID=1777142 RepID=UPI000BE4306F|nr:hypothetical protein [Caballeronia arationis]
MVAPYRRLNIHDEVANMRIVGGIVMLIGGAIIFFVTIVVALSGLGFIQGWMSAKTAGSSIVSIALPWWILACVISGIGASILHLANKRDGSAGLRK